MSYDNDRNNDDDELAKFLRQNKICNKLTKYDVLIMKQLIKLDDDEIDSDEVDSNEINSNKINSTNK